MNAPDAKLRFEAETLEGMRLWKLSGQIILDSSVLLREWAEQELNAGHRRFAVDMTAVNYANSAGIGALARVIHHIHEKNGMICFFNLLDHSIMRVFEIQPNFDIFETLEECRGFFLGLAPPMLYVILEKSITLESVLNNALMKYGKDRKFNIRAFTNADEAYNFMSEVNHPRIVALIDGIHPNAVNLLRKVKGHPEPMKRHPILIMVPPSNLDDLNQLLADKADDFIMSPPNSQELVIRLNQLKGLAASLCRER